MTELPRKFDMDEQDKDELPVDAIKVFVDGEEVPWALAYDIPEGTVRALKTDEDGEPVWNEIIKDGKRSISYEETVHEGDVRVEAV